MAFDTGYALVIGVSSYQHTPAMNVPITVEDAQEVAAVLSDRRYCGYPEQQVTLLHDTTATRQNIEAALDQFAATVKESDTFLLFYSGHGDYGDDGYYLTTYETEFNAGKVVTGSGIHEKTLLEKIKAIKAKRMFLIFNACHSGEISPDSLSGSSDSIGHSLPDRTATALLGTGEGRVIITACRETQRSYFLKTAAMTFFAQAVADGLRGRDIVNRRGYISIFDLYEYVFASVSSEVKQRFGALGFAQEPELTIQKGIGAMAIALHRGQAPDGELDNQDLPPTLSGAVREVEPIDCQQALQQILNGEFTVSGDVNVVARDQIDLRRSQGAIVNPAAGAVITQQFGNTTTINTEGGDYAGGNLSK
ncbi:MAG: caspase family protein [Leptolyngbyaceae cyanobacterium RU_5_1]|nr:caspase family protein [Leptolyngbyaceae cyanobacterium RU_5_1]